MQFKECLLSHVDPLLTANAEALSAVNKFIANIPGRILEIPFDASKTNKQGVKMGEKVYKCGCVAENGVIFLEYFENANQGEATMSIIVDKTKKYVNVKGWQVDKRLNLIFKVVGGKVEKACRVE